MRRRKTETIIQEETQNIKDWIFFQRKEPSVFGHIVGCNIKGCDIPKKAKLIDYSFAGTNEEAVKQAQMLERNGYDLKRG